MSQYGYTVLVTVFVPLLLIIWVSCLVICLYKHIITRLEKNKTEQGTSVRVVVENRNIITPQPQQQTTTPSATTTTTTTSVIPTQYAPVTSHLSSSLTMSDLLKMKSEVNLSDSLGPKYYPKAPISTIPEPPGVDEVFPSPIAPLVPPWPHLPPINSSNNDRITPSSATRSLNSSFNTRVNFLSNQILNPQNHRPQQRQRTGIISAVRRTNQNKA